MRILIGGDLCITEKSEIIVDDQIKELFANSDIRLLNMEAPLDDGLHHSVKKSGPILRQTSDVLKIIKDLDIDVLTLANNHILDLGPEGLAYTKNILSNYEVIGAGKWEEAYKPLVIRVGGLNVAFLNVCELQFGMLYDEWSQGDNAIGCAWANHSSVNRIINETKQQVDFLIAICHAGVENIDIPLPEWRSRYREMIDWGCDAVIAHHPHVIQGYEYYRKKPICYSLGNFCFPQQQGKGMGAIAMLNIDNKHLELEIQGCEIKDSHLRLVDADDMKKKMEELCMLLDTEEYMEKVNKVCVDCLKSYWNLFAMGGAFNPKKMTINNIGRIILGRYSHIHLLNNLQCESHRWCISRALRNEIGL